MEPGKQIIKAGYRSFKIYHFTGKVANTTKNLETKVRGGSDANANVSITSTTIIHDQIFLIDKEGKEKAMNLSGFDLSCRESNILTASWAMEEDDNLGPYFAITNYTTDQQFINDSIVRDLVKYGSKKRGALKVYLVYLAVLVALILIGIIISWILAVLLAIVSWGYYRLVKIPSWIKEFKSKIEYPKPELW